MMEETGRGVEAWCTCPEAVDKYAIKTWKHLMCLWKGQATGFVCVHMCACVRSVSQSALNLPFLHLSGSCLQFWFLYYGRRCIFMSLDEIWVRVTEEHADCQRHFTVYMSRPIQRDWGSSKKSNQPSTDRLMISDWAGRVEKQKKTWAKQREVDRLLIVSVIIWIVSCSLEEHDRIHLSHFSQGIKECDSRQHWDTLFIYFLLYLNIYLL